MPELPEVQTVVNTLIPLVVNQRIEDVQLHRADFLEPREFDIQANLKKQMVTSITRRGKRIIFLIANGNQFYIHLGMSGRLTINRPDTPVLKHTHFVLKFPNFEMRLSDPRRFGGVWWAGQQSTEDDMGPEPLTIRPKELAVQLSKTSRAIKNALLDQRVIAGLGNIYVDESLFAARIHPVKPADKLSQKQIVRLTRAIKQILRRALRHRGSTLRDYVDAEGGKGAFQKLHRVYDRAGLPCRNCKTPIKRIVMGGRSTCFCPKCQPLAAKS